MENKLNRSALQKYSSDYADAFFEKNPCEMLTGEAILALPQHKQINLQIVYGLFSRWQEERKRLESPYFDYSSAQVQEKMDELMNLLSRHIRVEAKNLRPLLIDAVSNTLSLIFDPYEWMREELSKKEVWKKEDLAFLRKFVIINAELAEGLVKMAGGKTLSRPVALSVLKDAWKAMEEELEDTLSPIKALSAIVPPDLDILYSGKGSVEAFRDEEVQPLAKKVIQPVAEFIPQEAPVAAPVASPQITKKTTKEGPSSKTLHDSISGAPKATLADIHSKNKAALSITKILTLNHRYMFTRELFKGDVEAFTQALDAIDRCANYDEAEEMISKKWIPRYHWDLDSEEVGEFLELVHKRFGD